MGSSDCFCALCSGPLGIYHINVGSKRAKDLDRRRKRLAGEETLEEEDEDVEMNDARSGDGAEGNEVGSNDGEEVDDAPFDTDEENIATIEEELGSDEDGDEEEQEWEDEESDHGSNSVHNSSAGEDGVASDQHNNSGSENGGAMDDEDDDFSDGWSQASDLSLPDAYEMHHGCRDEKDNMYKYYEENSYDPTIVKREDVRWIDRCRALGLNRELKGKKRAFISGRGRYSDLFTFDVNKSSSDPRDPNSSEHPAYHSWEPEEQTAAFPFHEECYKLLTRCMGYASRKEVDKDALYEIMKQNTPEMAKSLNLDYGDIKGADQFWESYSGQEWSVANPGPKPGIEEVVKSMLPASLFSPSANPALELSDKVKYDPLTVLPYDVLHSIFENLSLKDTLSLVNSSLHVFDSTRQSTFWRQMIRFHIVSFFYELDGMLKKTTFPDTFDWKGAFQWLDKITKPTLTMEGPMMAIANRRRIWNVCEQVSSLYYEKLNAEVRSEPSAAEAASILNAAQSFHIPLTLWPPPAANDTSTITTQFIRSWSEIGYLACDIETYWSEQHCEYGTLVGMSIDFGSGPRLFGKAEGVQGLSLHLKAGDWIKGIQVFVWPTYQDHTRSGIRTIKNRDDSVAVNEGYINGMTICLTSGAERVAKAAVASSDKAHRMLSVLPGMHFVGLKAETTSNGTISRLGLLQAPQPSPNPFTPPTYAPKQLVLWAPEANIYSETTRKTYPIYAAPDIHIHTFPSHDPPAFVHVDMLPYQLHLWAEHNNHKYLQRIMTFEIADENGKASILGLTHKTTHAYGGQDTMGNAGPVPAQMGERWKKAKSTNELELWKRGPQTWDENYTKHFDIDGPGGEVVREVHVTSNRRGFKLVTNWGREGLFGETEGVNSWEVRKARKGKVVVGLTACFGHLGGWSEGAQAWSHFGLWDLGVVVAVMEEMGKE